jgi:hypothetical protein
MNEFLQKGGEIRNVKGQVLIGHPAWKIQLIILPVFETEIF